MSACGLFLSLTVFSAVRVGENIVVNGTFENDQAEVPDFWTMDSWNHPENLAVRPTGGPKGLPSIGARAPADGKPTSFGICQRGFVLDPQGRYRLTGWVKKRDFVVRQRSGLVFAGASWTDDSGIDFSNGTCDWTKFSADVKPVKSSDGMLRLCLFVQDYTGSLEIADVRLEALDEETARKTGRSALFAAQSAPRLVPWLPLLAEVPADDPKVTLRFFGQVADLAACEAVLTADGAPDVRAPLPAKGGDVTFVLPRGAKEGRFTVAIADRTTGERLFERTHGYRTVEPCGDFPAGKRLNNLVVELFRGPVPSGTLTFGLKGGSWVYVAAKGTDEVRLDGKPVICADTPRGETFRELEAGRHVLTAKGTAAELTVRRIPELFAFAPAGNPVREAATYDWSYYEKYVLPALTTFNGGVIPQEARRRYRDSGRLWLANLISRELKDDADLAVRLRTCGAMQPAAIFQDGVTCDEQGFTGVPTMARYAAGLWAYGNPHGRRVYTWAIGKPATENVDHDLLSAAANGADGRGKFLSEIYLKTKPTEALARAAMELATSERMRQYRKFTPLADRRYGIIFGCFTQAPQISLAVCPEADYRYFLDMQFNMLANDPHYRDLACTGVWGNYRADEEMHRWTFMLMRHYFVEGRTGMLSERYGFTYAPGHLANPDFADGLAHWQTSPDVTADSHARFGQKAEGRWLVEQGLGDSFAVLPRTEEGTASVWQTAKKLVPGRKYTLRFAAFDVEDVKKDRFDPRRVGLEASVEGAEIDPSLSWEHVAGAGDAKKSGVRVNFRQIAFTARSAEATVRFTSETARPGEKVGVNFISLLPYLSRSEHNPNEENRL